MTTKTPSPSGSTLAFAAGVLVLLAVQSAVAVTKPAPAAAASAASAPAVGTPVPAAGVKGSAAAKAGSAAILELDWEELVPQDARSKFAGAGPPTAVHDYLGEGGMAAQQPMDFSVNQQLDGVGVKLPGFIVPLDVGKDGLVSEVSLAPYFGACIHVPPPPPNQIVYVKMAKGIALDSIYEAYWATGKMSISKKTTQPDAAAYSLAASKVEIYKYLSRQARSSAVSAPRSRCPRCSKESSPANCRPRSSTGTIGSRHFATSTRVRPPTSSWSRTSRSRPPTTSPTRTPR